jgi:hypothetical protein
VASETPIDQNAGRDVPQGEIDAWRIWNDNNFNVGKTWDIVMTYAKAMDAAKQEGVAQGRASAFAEAAEIAEMPRRKGCQRTGVEIARDIRARAEARDTNQPTEGDDDA